MYARPRLGSGKHTVGRTLANGHVFPNIERVSLQVDAVAVNCLTAELPTFVLSPWSCNSVLCVTDNRWHAIDTVNRLPDLLGFEVVRPIGSDWALLQLSCSSSKQPHRFSPR